jgi:hypothetical protein
MGARLLQFLIFLIVAPVFVFAVFLFRKQKKTLPMYFDTFDKFLPAALKKQRIWLAVSALATLLGGFMPIGFIVLLLTAVPWITFKPGYDPKTAPDPKKLEAEAQAFNEQWLASLGATPADRARAIEAIFEQKSQTISASLFEKWEDRVFDPNVPNTPHYIYATISRNLAAMDHREREALRFAEHLNSLANGQGYVIQPSVIYGRWRLALLWGDGKGHQETQTVYLGLDAADPIGDYMKRRQLSVPGVINAISIQASQMKDDPTGPAEQRQVCQEIFQALGGSPA